MDASRTRGDVGASCLSAPRASLPRTPLSRRPARLCDGSRSGFCLCGKEGGGREGCSRQLVEAGRFGGEKVVLVAARGNHTVAVTAEGRLFTWGNGEYGRLGHGDTGDMLVPRRSRTRPCAPQTATASAWWRSGGRRW